MRRTGLMMLAVGAALSLALDGGRSSGQDKPAPAKAVAAPDADEATVKRFEQSYGRYFKQMHQAELQFVQAVTEPTKEQYDKIAADGDAAVKSAARGLALAQRGRNGAQTFDPRAMIAEAVAKSVKANLSPEQLARYEKETALKTAARKRLVIKNMVAMIDRVLYLRADQREKIGEVLTANWDNSWNQTQIFMYGGQYFPAMPDAKIVPLLSEPQRVVWRGISKGNVQFGINWGGGFNGEMMEIEDGVAVEVAPEK